MSSGTSKLACGRRSLSFTTMDDPKRLRYIMNHIFMPPKLPQANDDSAENDEALCVTAYRCAVQYVIHLPTEKLPSWRRIIRMLSSIRELYIAHNVDVFDTKTVKRLLRIMIPGGKSISDLRSPSIHLFSVDTFAALIRAQNAGIVFRKLE